MNETFLQFIGNPDVYYLANIGDYLLFNASVVKKLQYIKATCS